MQSSNTLRIIVLIILVVLLLGLLGLVGASFAALHVLATSGLHVPNREAARLEASYADAVTEVEETLAADQKAIRDALDAARAAVPPDAPILPAWDFERALDVAWIDIEQDTLDDLSYDFLGNEGEAGSLSKTMLTTLTEWLEPARLGGNITPFEALVDPSLHPPETVRRNFCDFVIASQFLDEMESAIDLGLARRVPEPGGDNEKYYRGRRWTATKLLGCRAMALDQSGRREEALEACLRLYRLADLAEVETCCAIHAHNYAPGVADKTLAYLLQSGPVDEGVRAVIRESAQRRRDNAIITKQIQVIAVYDRGDFRPFFEHETEEYKHLYTYRALEQAEKLIALMDRPYFECRDRIWEIADRYAPEYMLDHDGASGGDTIVSDGVGMVQLKLAMMTGRNPMCDLTLILTHMAVRGRSHARDAFTPEVTEMAFALADFKERNGQYPDALDELIPELLPSESIDPISGEPVKYTRNGDGYTLTAPYLHRPESHDDVLWKTTE